VTEIEKANETEVLNPYLVSGAGRTVAVTKGAVHPAEELKAPAKITSPSKPREVETMYLSVI